MRIISRLLFCIGVVMLTVPVFGQGDTQPRFGSEIIVLGFADNQLLSHPDLSPDGAFVFAHATAYSRRDSRYSFISAKQYLWDLGETGAGAEVRYLLPARQLRVDETEFGHGHAFSPNGQYLALGTPKDLQILTLPDLDLYRSAPVIVNIDYPWIDHLSWSADSQYVATLMNNDILVWGVVANQLLRHALDWQYSNVSAIGTGWFGQYRDSFGEEEGGFFVCTLRLESCIDYRLPTPLIAASSQAGDLFLTTTGDFFSNVGASIQLWQRQDSSNYQMEDMELTTREVGCPRRFSADDRYLALACSFNVWTIREFPSFELVHSFPDNERPNWLAGNDYLVSFDPFKLSLSLYRLGSDEPLDTINLIERLGEDVRDLLDSEAVTSQLPDVSADGRRVLITLGWAALVIPIEYS